ncbi:hypothetical protein ACQ7CX_17780 [Chryseobacterium arthrosphaerae]|uniref:hypothetical protein n=1 Tax=Chryseobacterium arthrosphaerae TaxID=651561 RepID=UPI001BAF2ACF|nr:hypothetical protein [Chryseobacterium arthrosphaerae]QUY55476.1 hypothetical protein I2F65_21900 [Chryseobacterium arthrosphaerae]
MSIQLVNPATNETLNYYPTTTFLHNGSSIPSTINTDDGVIYLEHSGNTYVLEDYMGGHPINVRRFGLNNGTDDRGYTSAAIIKGIKLAKKYNYRSLYIPNGDYDIAETVNIDVAPNTTIKIEGNLNVKDSFTGNAIVIGTHGPAITQPTKDSLVGLNIQGLNCSKKNYNDSDSTGIVIMNVIASTIEIKRVTGFKIGTLLYSDNGRGGGISYNTFFLNYFHDNEINLKFEKNDVQGYINENTFYGGTFNHSTIFPKVKTFHILMDDKQINLHPYNNNRFLYPSFEDNDPVNATAAKITGESNTIVGPRMENPNNPLYTIKFDEHSKRCQVISKGFGLYKGSIEDLGDENSYETNSGNLLTTNSANPVLTLRNQASSAFTLYSGLDVSNNEVFFVTGEGKGFYGSSLYAEKGFRWATSDGSKEDRGLFYGNGSPTVAANPGSIYINNDGGNKMLWVKTDSGSSAGWKSIGTQADALTAPEPSSSATAQDVWLRLKDLEDKLKAAGLLSS